MDNQQGTMRELALFAGTGGGILGGILSGWRTVCAVEIEPYAAGVLVARQNDGVLPPFPIWDDIRTFDGKPWRGIVDVVSGGFPCQDISTAGRGAGIEGEKSGLWKEMARIIGEVRPRYVYVENSPMLIVRGIERVVGDLVSMGYDAQWGVVSAADTGAPHLRERIWIRAVNGNTNGNSESTITQHEETPWMSGLVADSNGAQCERRQLSIRGGKKHAYFSRAGWWEIEPDVGRVVDGMAARVDRLTAIGNGQVPRVAATAWEMLS